MRRTPLSDDDAGTAAFRGRLHALDEPYTAVISESIANKYYGGEEAVGQTFRLNKGAVFRITGIFRDVPSNTHFKFNILISWPTYVQWRGADIETAWFWDGFYTYIRLRRGRMWLFLKRR